MARKGDKVYAVQRTVTKVNIFTVQRTETKENEMVSEIVTEYQTNTPTFHGG